MLRGVLLGVTLFSFPIFPMDGIPPLLLLAEGLFDAPRDENGFEIFVAADGGEQDSGDGEMELFLPAFGALL